MPETITNTLNKLGEKRMMQASYHNRNAKGLPSLQKGDVVCITPAKYSKHLQKATAQRQVNVRTYEVETDYGSVFRRNRRHTRQTTAPHAVPKIEPQIGLPPETGDTTCVGRTTSATPVRRSVTQPYQTPLATATPPIVERYSDRHVRRPVHLNYFV